MVINDCLPPEVLRAIASARAKATQAPSLALNHAVELDSRLANSGFGEPVTFSAHGIAMPYSIRSSFDRDAAMQLNTLWEAEQFRKYQGDMQAAACGFLHARGPELAALNLLYTNLSCRVETLWLHFLNKYLAYFHPTKYRITLRLLHGSRFSRLRSASSDSLSKRGTGPLVTVIMPVFNASATLEMAVRSILEQTWQQFELLLIDDDSSDGSLDLAREMAKRDARIKVLALSRNGGPYIAKNVALTKARGDYITVHDADDWAFPTRIEDQVVPLLTDSNFKVSMGYMLRMTSEGLVSRFSPVCEFCTDGALRWCHPSLLFERRYFETRLGAWDSVRVGADAEIMRRIQTFERPRLKILNIPVMLQLDIATSLTRARDTFIDERGSAPLRAAYCQAWETWHQSNRTMPRLEFPLVKRPYPVPDGMQLHSLGVEALIERVPAGA